MEFKLSVFRFNAKTDYLPYYKKYEVQIDKNLKLCDLLKNIQEQDMFFNYPISKNASIFVNSYALSTQVELLDIEKNFGSELILEPLSKRRAVLDLTIDSGDFDNIFNKFNATIGNCEKKIYDEYIRYFYASAVLNYNKNFQGSSLFLFATYMIEKYPQKREDILKFISDEENGIWYHSSLKIFPKNDAIEDKINKLKKEICTNYTNLPIVKKIAEKFANL